MKLQNNFTTPEQSKRLLELGVLVNSADCYLDVANNRRGMLAINGRYEMDVPDNIICKDGSPCYLPCWSLGRLIEIVLKCLVLPDGQKPSITFFINDPNISLMESLIINLTNGRCEYDFSRLDLNEE